MLCQQLFKHPKDFVGGWNFGPNDEGVKPVSVVADIMVDSWANGAEWSLDDGAHPHEAMFLKLDCSKAKIQLKWNPIWNLERSLDETVLWYKAWVNQVDMGEYTLSQIETYHKESLAQ